MDGRTQTPLSDVHVYLQKDSAGITMTNREGEFLIPRNRVGENDTLVFSRVGYHPLRATLAALESMKGRVVLYEQARTLAEVVVPGERGFGFLECSKLASLPRELFAFGGFLKDDKIYVVAGDETFSENVAALGQGELFMTGTYFVESRSPRMYAYDIPTDTWDTLSVKVAPRAGHAAHCYRDKAFIIGGLRYSTNRRLEFTDATMEVYDMKRDTLFVDPVNPHQGTGFASFVYDDCLYVMGGAVKERKFTDRIHLLDLKSGVWYESAERIPAEYLGKRNGILVGHKVYFFGGWRGTPQWTSVSYDLQTGKWEPLCDLTESASYPALATDGERIYIYENGYLQVYDLKRDSIRRYRTSLDSTNAGIFYADGTLYVVGGCRHEGEDGDAVTLTPQNGVYAFDVSWMQ